MLNTLRGCFAFGYIILNTVFWASLLFPTAFIKLIIPLKPWRRLCTAVLDRIALSWIACNNFALDHFLNIEWDIRGFEDLNPRAWYLVICNHQTWVDIPVLQRVLHRRIPFLKFFLKKELIKVPILGLAWWALDFPFMKRYSREFIEQNPQLKGKDLEITKKACEKFSELPVAVMNFVEGTRFTPAKHAREESPFRHLLNPKAGGVSFVLAAMGDQLTEILDLTITYPGCEDNSFWAFMCGRIRKISVRLEHIPISEAMIGDYANDEKFRAGFQQWLNSVWQHKDDLISAELAG